MEGRFECKNLPGKKPPPSSFHFQISKMKKHKHEHYYFPEGDATKKFREKYYPDISHTQWSSWKWQLNHTITCQKTLTRFLQLTNEEEKFFKKTASGFPLSITPYYLSLFSLEDCRHPLRRSVVPVESEYTVLEVEMTDPLGEDRASPVPGIVHRYPDRVLFLITTICSTYCRYCTRSRIVSKTTQTDWDRGIEYIKQTKTVRDVLISGGDPFTLPDKKLETLLFKLRKIPHVEIIRIGTKVPVVLPYRITHQLTEMLKAFHPLYMNIHFTHPHELTPETKEACNRLADAGIPLGSQTVLLRGINDNVEVMASLLKGLLQVRVKPYYIFQCDLAPGTSHLRSPVEKGLEIIKGLCGFTSGLAIPHYVIDAPDGGGKIPLLPDYIITKNPDHYVLRNFQDKVYIYPDMVC